MSIAKNYDIIYDVQSRVVFNLSKHNNELILIKQLVLIF